MYKRNLMQKSDLLMGVAFQRGSTLLHQAAWKGHLPFVVWLLQHGAQKSLFVRNKLGHTPLEAAHIFGPYPEVEALLGSAMVDPSFDPKSILLHAKSGTQRLSVPASVPCHSSATRCELTELEQECSELRRENDELKRELQEFKAHSITRVLRQGNADVEKRLTESEGPQQDSGLHLELDQYVAELDSPQGVAAKSVPSAQWRQQLGELEQRQNQRSQEMKAQLLGCLGQSDQRRLESERHVREELQQRDLASEMRVLALEERLAALEAAAPSSS